MISRDGKSQRKEEKRRRKKIEEEKVRRKKTQVREKVGKLRNTVGCGASWRFITFSGNCKHKSGNPKPLREVEITKMGS